MLVLLLWRVLSWVISELMRVCLRSYFCKLHTLSTAPECILQLCKVFESLVQVRGIVVTRLCPVLTCVVDIPAGGVLSSVADGCAAAAYRVPLVVFRVRGLF